MLPYLNTVPSAGMEGVAELKTWNDLGMLGEPDIKPRQRQTLMSMDPDEFIEIMKRWLWAYNLDPGKAIPGVASSEISTLALPTMIVRGGKKDLQHPDEVSREVAKLIPGRRAGRAAVAGSRERVESSRRPVACRTASPTSSRPGTCWRPRSSTS